MGRIKTVLVKRTTDKLMNSHSEKFGSDFTANKIAVSELTTCRSKKLRNIIAGYATRLNRKVDTTKKKKAPATFNRRR